jgi:aminopeptidase N
MKYLLLVLFCSIFQSSLLAQTQDVKRISAEIELLPETKIIKAEVEVKLSILQKTNELYLDSKIENIESVVSGNDTLQFITDNGKLIIRGDFKPSEYSFKISYIASPKQTLYFVNDLNEHQVFTQGQGKYTSHWLPSIDDMTDKIEFDLTITAPKSLAVMASGTLDSVNTTKTKKTWYYDMKQPMSSYLVALAAGQYDKKTINSASGVPIQLYFEPKDTEEVEATYRHTEHIFNFLETEIGVPYPWQNYKQVYVKDFLYAGMENTSLTIFSDAFVTDATGFIDRNYVNVNAHELAHQWFGDLVTEESSAHHWLHEGFATYYALLAEREIFGDDYFYWKLYESAERLKEMSDSGKGEALTNPKASSLTFYEKGAWALHILREEVGDLAFKIGVKQYLNTYAYKNVTIDDFLAEMEKASGKELSAFKANWLDQSAFKAEAALNSLKSSEFMQQYFEISALRETPLEDKADLFFQVLSVPKINTYIGQELVYQLANEPYSEALSLLRMAFNTNDILIRQAIVANVKEIPKALQSEFESLLKDNSYQTNELALYALWSQFPNNRVSYLKELKGIKGFSDHNIELLWLTLNLATQNYEPSKKSDTFQKLTSYTNSMYSYQIRELAFNYLYQIEAFSDESLMNLVNATTHHVWRFKNFSRELLKELIKKPDYKKRLLQLKATFTKEENAYLDTLLK